MTHRPLSVWLPLLAAGCVTAHSSCEDFEPSTFANETTFGITQEELDAAVDADGALTDEGCEALCRDRHWMPDVIVSIDSCERADDGSIPDSGDAVAAVHCAWTENAVCEGRAHEVVTSKPEGVGRDVLGAWLARGAHAEAASIGAFVALANELARHGAPASLVARAREAARDEVRHARILRRAAALRGAAPTRPTFGRTPDRSLVALAVENVVEGCVRETWAATVAHHQAVASPDPELRAAFASIAADEARHGELAFAIDAWLSTRLTAAERAEVEAARSDAVAQLIGGLDEPDRGLEAAGLPSAEVARQLACSLAPVVWS